MVAPLPVAAQSTQPSRALTYSVRALTSEDLAASAGVAELEKPPQQPRRTVSRRQRAKQKVNWDPFGFDSPGN